MIVENMKYPRIGTGVIVAKGNKVLLGKRKGSLDLIVGIFLVAICILMRVV